MLLQPEQAVEVIKVCVVLHNYLRAHSTVRNVHTPPGDAIPEDENVEPLPDSMVGLSQQVSNDPEEEAKKVRKRFSRYFTSVLGSVPWQWTSIGVTE